MKEKGNMDELRMFKRMLTLLGSITFAYWFMSIINKITRSAWFDIAKRVAEANSAQDIYDLLKGLSEEDTEKLTREGSVILMDIKNLAAAIGDKL